LCRGVVFQKWRWTELTLQRHFSVSTKFTHVESRFCGRKQRGKAAFDVPVNLCVRSVCSKSVAVADIEQPLTQRNLINLAHILSKQSKDVDLHLVETFNEVVNLTVYAHPDPMNPFEQLENPA